MILFCTVRSPGGGPWKRTLLRLPGNCFQHVRESNEERMVMFGEFRNMLIIRKTGREVKKIVRSCLSLEPHPLCPQRLSNPVTSNGVTEQQGKGDGNSPRKEDISNSLRR